MFWEVTHMNGSEPAKKGGALFAASLVVLGIVFAEATAALVLQVARSVVLDKQQKGSGGDTPAPVPEQTYTITWLNDDGTVLEVDTDVAKDATPSYDGTTPTKASQGLISYTFKGWNHEPTIVTANATYVATYTIAYNNATVTFNMGGHGDQVDPQSVAYNTLVTKPVDPTAEGYVFVGWFKEATALLAWNFASDKVTSDVTLYARWVEVQNLTVTFDNGGHGDPVASQVVPYGGKAINPGAPQNYDTVNWEFVGWNYNDEPWDFNNSVTSDMTLVAEWIGIK